MELPLNCMEIILSHLTSKERFGLLTVSKRFESILRESRLSFDLSGSDFRSMERVPHAIYVDASRCTGLPFIKESYHRVIELSGTKITDVDIGRLITKNKVFHSLILRDANCVKYNFFWRLSNRSIRVLNLSRTNLTDDNILQMSSLCMNIETLNVSDCTLLTNDCVKYLSNMKLTTLNIGKNNIMIDGDSLPLSLKRLYIDCCLGVGDETMRCLGTRDLTLLSIRECPRITNRGVRLLTMNESLTELDISGCINLTSGCLRYLDKIRVLRLEKMMIKNYAYDWLKSIEVLYLRGTVIGQIGVNILTRYGRRRVSILK